MVGVEDFGSNGQVDILWRRADNTGAPRFWLLDGATVTDDFELKMPDPGWKVGGVGDVNGDGKAEILWRRSNGSGEMRLWVPDRSCSGCLRPCPGLAKRTDQLKVLIEDLEDRAGRARTPQIVAALRARIAVARLELANVLEMSTALGCSIAD